MKRLWKTRISMEIKLTTTNAERYWEIEKNYSINKKMKSLFFVLNEFDNFS